MKEEWLHLQSAGETNASIPFNLWFHGKVLTLTNVDFMQIDQTVGQYHLKGTDILQKVISFKSIVVQTRWGAKQSSTNYKISENAWPKAEENILGKNVMKMIPSKHLRH